MTNIIKVKSLTQDEKENLEKQSSNKLIKIQETLEKRLDKVIEEEKNLNVIKKIEQQYEKDFFLWLCLGLAFLLFVPVSITFWKASLTMTGNG